MRRVLFVVCALLLAATVLAPAASAQYVKPPGNGPNVGSTDNGVVSTDAPGDVTPPGGTTGPPTEVKGKQFARDISASNSGFQLYWLWLLMALGLGLAFLILWRRRREEEEDDFSGAQPA